MTIHDIRPDPTRTDDGPTIHRMTIGVGGCLCFVIGLPLIWYFIYKAIHYLVYHYIIS